MIDRIMFETNSFIMEHIIISIVTDAGTRCSKAILAETPLIEQKNEVLVFKEHIHRHKTTTKVIPPNVPMSINHTSWFVTIIKSDH